MTAVVVVYLSDMPVLLSKILLLIKTNRPRFLWFMLYSKLAAAAGFSTTVRLKK